MNGTAALLKQVEARQMAASGRARGIRERAGLTQEEVASEVGRNAATISRWEQGQRKPRGDEAVRWLELMRQLERMEGVRERAVPA